VLLYAASDAKGRAAVVPTPSKIVLASPSDKRARAPRAVAYILERESRR
jgi:hypothetical protein